jgi:aspartate aminotransferase
MKSTDSFLDPRMSAFGESRSSMAVSRLTRARHAGADIVSLLVGEPDFDTPPHIRKAACDAIAAGHTRYTVSAGIQPLREAVCRKLARDNGVACDPSRVIVTTGAKQAIFLAFMASVGQGDEVIVPAPYWVSYPEMVRLFGGTPVIVPGSPARALKVAPAALVAAITPRTKWLVLNFPANPTGANLAAQDASALVRLLEEHPHVRLMTDEVYEHVVYAGGLASHPLALAPRLADRVLIVNSLSKTYAMTGWRVGYAAGPQALINAMVSLQSQSTSNTCTVAQHAALAALDGPQGFIQAWRSEYASRWRLLVRRLDGCFGLRCIEPEGAFYVFVDCSSVIGRVRPDGRLIESDGDVADHLFDHGVAVIEGDAFGMSPWFRASVATSEANIKKACDRIVAALERLK